MDIDKKSHCELLIKGNIKDVDDCEKIEKAIKEMIKDGCTNIKLIIPKSFSFPSTVMGIMAKLTKKQGIHFAIYYGDKRLGKTLKRLELDRMFTIEKLDK
jgi:hypothetical protein